MLSRLFAFLTEYLKKRKFVKIRNEEAGSIEQANENFCIAPPVFALL